MRWLGHVVRMDDGRIPKDLIYGELVQGKRPTGRPQLRLKDICKRDLKALNIDQNNWEATALERSAWRQTVQEGLTKFEEALAQQHEERRMGRKAAAQGDRPTSVFICASAAKTATPASDWQATPDAVQGKTLRAQLHVYECPIHRHRL